MAKIEERRKLAKLNPQLEEQFLTGRLYGKTSAFCFSLPKRTCFRLNFEFVLERKQFKYVSCLNWFALDNITVHWFHRYLTWGLWHGQSISLDFLSTLLFNPLSTVGCYNADTWQIYFLLLA